MPITLDLEQWFWSNVQRGNANECWPWTGPKFSQGYGYAWRARKAGLPQGAHRLAWTLANGEIPEGLLVCHRCDNKPCCNPAHLWLGTIKDNMRDRERKGRGKHVGAGGSARGFSQLNEVQVLQIRQRLGDGEFMCDLASEFFVSETTIDNIKRRQTWRHI